VRVLVTGGGGFIGGAICRALLARGDEVTTYQRSASPELENLGARVIRGCITDADKLGESLRGMDAVIHTAAKAGLSVRYDDFYQPNVIGTGNIIAACLQNSIRKLVFTSSPSVTHADGDIEGGDESLPYADDYHSPYPATKALSEQMVWPPTALNCIRFRCARTWFGDPVTTTCCRTWSSGPRAAN